MRCQGQGRLRSIGTDIMQIMDKLVNSDGDAVMSDNGNEFIQVSWRYDKNSGKDVAKVCFVFDGAVSIDSNATPEKHDSAMRDAVKKCSDLVSDVAATFGSLAHTRALRYLMWLADKEITVDNDSARWAYREARNKFTNTVMETM